jgi:hypothetical protein
LSEHEFDSHGGSGPQHGVRSAEGSNRLYYVQRATDNNISSGSALQFRNTPPIRVRQTATKVHRPSTYNSLTPFVHCDFEEPFAQDPRRLFSQIRYGLRASGTQQGFGDPPLYGALTVKHDECEGVRGCRGPGSGFTTG